jgi:hypothetical protein
MTLDGLIEVYGRFGQSSLNMEATEYFDTSVNLEFFLWLNSPDGA